MGFTKADFPPVDPETFLQQPLMERMKVLALHWVEHGFGSPRMIHTVRPPLSAAGFRPRPGSSGRCGVVGEPGGPAEAERAVDQHLVAADRDIGADLEVGPAQLVLDLLAALLNPVPDAVDPGDLGQVRCRVNAVGLARAAPAGASWWPGTRLRGASGSGG